MTNSIAFIGGGQMASALIGGLIQRGMSADKITVVEPFEGARADLLTRLGVQAQTSPGRFLQAAALVVWAIKPQTFAQAAQAAQADTRAALHLSVAAGIRSDTLAQWLHSERIVRAMPNTPALIGQGISGLYARAGVDSADKAQIEKVMGCTGSFMWLDAEAQIDAVTALSGSGPAYVFYFLEAMREAGSAMGLTPAQSYQLAIATFSGASALAAASDDAPEVLRERVTSKGGTTFAALCAMQDAGVKAAFIAAMQAARQRAQELGDAFGASN